MTALASTRAEREAQARELRDQGLKLREIAERMGVAVSTVSAWLTDPGGEQLKARKRTYQMACVDCGGPCDGASGAARRSTRCQSCANEHATATRKWTADTVREAIVRWTAEHGRPPSAEDSRADELLPVWNTIAIQEAGGWWQLLVSLGLKDPDDRKGCGRGPGSVTDDDVMDAIWAYREHGSTAGAATALGISTRSVCDRMNRHREGRKLLMAAQSNNGHGGNRATIVLQRELERSEQLIEQKREEIEKLESESATLRETIEFLAARQPA